MIVLREPAEPVRCLATAILAVAMGVGLVGWTGCQRTDSPTDSGTGVSPASAESTGKLPATADLASAQQVLDAMVAAYKKAQTYSDHGVLRLVATVNGQKDERSAPYSVVWERPNKLRMHALSGRVVCDGKQFHAHFPAMEGQLARRPAPAQLTIPFLLGDAIFNSAISVGGPSQFSMVPPQLLLLWAKDPMKTIRYHSKDPVLLASQKIGDYECYRVQWDRPDGKVVVWIDRRTSILRRIELPIEQMQKEAAEDKVELQSCTAEFVDAQFDGQIDQEEFRIEVPASIQIVEYLMPPPLLPLGKPAPDFHFVGMDGKAIDRAALQGKVAVIEFWATFCEPCRQTMPLLEKVYQKYKVNPKIVFLAVNVDEKTVPDKEVQAKLAGWQATVPIARDPDQDASKKFGIRPIPAMCLVGASGTVQDYGEGFRQSLDTELAAKIEKLLAGQDISQEPLRRWDEERKQFAASLEARADQELYVDTPEAPEVKIAEPTKPKAFTLVPLWKSADVTRPGNLLVVPQPAGPPRLLLIDDMKSVVEVAPDGKRKALYPLDIPAGEVIGLLRTATDSSGKRYFLAAVMGGVRVHLFDENWKRLLSIPENPGAGGTGPSPVSADSTGKMPVPPEQLLVADAELADLDGDGKPEILVSYFNGGGVQCFSLEGKELWRNQEMKQTPSVAVARGPAGEPIVLCANERERLLSLDAKGKRVGDFGPEKMFISIMAADLGPASRAGILPAELQVCGISLLPDSTTRVAVGLGPKGEQKQAYTLPTGMLPGSVEQIVPGRLAADGPGCWLLPGADGSIHVLAADGQFLDQFNSGGMLTGLATLVLDGRPVLVVASSRGLEAFQIELPAKPK